jgi:hypothetical protein
MEPTLNETMTFDPPNFTFPFGAHICVTEVDTETGAVKIRDYYAVDDCGPVINPTIVDGQLHGGLAQGIAQALYEGVIYDEEGNLLTASMVNYMIPGAPELPNYTLDRTVTPSPSNPLGVKGVGEAGTIGAPPAVINSVVDALSPLGIRHIDMPASPMRVWKAIQNAQGCSRATGRRTPRWGRALPTSSRGVTRNDPDGLRLRGRRVRRPRHRLARPARRGLQAPGGGHSLIPIMRLRLAAPTVLIDLGRLEELRYVRDGGDHLAIGAMTRHRDLLFNDLVKEHCGIVGWTAGLLGDPSVQHRGTLGGTWPTATPRATCRASSRRSKGS